MTKTILLTAATIMIAFSVSARNSNEVGSGERLREVAAIGEGDSVGRADAIERLVVEVSREGREALVRISERAEAMWYDPESTEMDEGLFQMWLKRLVESPLLSDVDKVRPLSQLEEMGKNPVGQPATDIEVECADGSRVSLMSLLAKDGNTLVVFYDPDCDHCDEVIERVSGEGYRDAERIVSVCVEGDSERWHERLMTMPAEWVNVYGATTLGMDAEEEVYVLRSMPTVYLISADGIVVAKNIRL